MYFCLEFCKPEAVQFLLAVFKATPINNTHMGLFRSFLLNQVYTVYNQEESWMSGLECNITN